MPETIPSIGLGTWKSAPGEVGAAVEQALRMGYRHLDCASIYGNEAEIGAALKRCFAEGVVRREDLWVTSKLWSDRHAAEDVGQALELTLCALQLDYLDLYLIHWPVVLRRDVPWPTKAEDMVALDSLPTAETWGGMERAVEGGLSRQIGVSNFSATKLAALIEGARVRPAANQVERHPYLQQPALTAYCREQGVELTAYSPLGSRDRPAELKEADEPILLEDPLVMDVASRHGVSPAQVLVAWAVGCGTSVIPKSVDPGRMRENLAAGELKLGDEDMRKIDALDRARRYVPGAFWAFEGGPYTLANLWDE